MRTVAVNDRKGRKLAWSSTGSIARISPDGRKISFSVFIQDAKTGAWAPGKESSFPILAPDASRFVHLHFSGIGSELAAVDDVGLVHIYVSQTGLGRMAPCAMEVNHDRQGRGELDAVVGLHWLPLWPVEFRVGADHAFVRMGGALTESRLDTVPHRPK